MWERKELKDNAKYVLRTSYWKAFLVSLILGFVGGGARFPDLNFNFGSSSNGSFDSETGFIDWGLMAPIFALAAGLIIVFIIFAISFRIFLGFPLEVGSIQYFKRSAEQDVNLNHLGYAFNSQRYLKIVAAMLWRGFLNFLWYLLLIIPGIVKSYAYSLVPYILADNPNIGYNRAVDLSNQMTRGHKFRMFVLDLSFIGWILLGLLACFVGVLFVMPYINATKAELYLALRKEALERNLTTEAELQLVPPPLY
ncbi:DUF975 family protein [Paenibacillus pinisoli]|uniref:DUF975 family protein n=1 Tax=Paenibacillus pinisoli TaxID=1276110 RepID=A0A3A6PHR0_9BACL|nr:DUF975 family protein [Paenibacillus pinisoli]RJX39820.1 DUF975 family protein [Paenibacillus pinisoli]